MLLDSLARDGDLSAGSAERVIGDLRRRLNNRLEVEAWYDAHPEIETLEVRGPVDINGLPRTGTTALASMLSLDPQFRRCAPGSRPNPARHRSSARKRAIRAVYVHSGRTSRSPTR